MTVALGKLWTTLRKQQNPLEHKNQGWLHKKAQAAFYLCHPSFSLAQLSPRKMPSEGFHLQGKENRRTPAILLTYAICILCHQGPLQRVSTNAEPPDGAVQSLAASSPSQGWSYCGETCPQTSKPLLCSPLPD